MWTSWDIEKLSTILAYHLLKGHLRRYILHFDNPVHSCSKNEIKISRLYDLIINLLDWPLCHFSQPYVWYPWFLSGGFLPEVWPFDPGLLTHGPLKCEKVSAHCQPSIKNQNMITTKYLVNTVLLLEAERSRAEVVMSRKRNINCDCARWIFVSFFAVRLVHDIPLSLRP